MELQNHALRPQVRGRDPDRQSNTEIHMLNASVHSNL